MVHLKLQSEYVKQEYRCVLNILNLSAIEHLCDQCGMTTIYCLLFSGLTTWKQLVSLEVDGPQIFQYKLLPLCFYMTFSNYIGVCVLENSPSQHICLLAIVTLFAHLREFLLAETYTFAMV